MQEKISNSIDGGTQEKIQEDPGQKFSKFMKDEAGQWCEFSGSQLDDAVNQAYKGTSNPPSHFILPKNTFVAHNGSILVSGGERGDTYYWTYGDRDKVESLKALGLTQDTSKGVPFANMGKSELPQWGMITGAYDRAQEALTQKRLAAERKAKEDDKKYSVGA